MDASRKRPPNRTNLDKSVFLANLPSLREMAFYRTALQLWYSYNTRRRKSAPLTEREEKIFDKLAEKLAISSHMMKILKKCLKKIREETNRCIRYFENGLFSIHLDEYKISQVDCNCFAWFPNGQIDYKNTAIKILSSSKLTEEQKFAIMCKYCLVNELDTFHLNRLPTNFIDKVRFDSDPLLFYWIRYLRRELDKIPSRFPNSLDVEMAFKCTTESSQAFEFFWDHLSTANQTQFIIERLKSSHCSPPDNCSRLFYKMSEEQLTHLLIFHADYITPTFLTSMNMPRCAIWAWMHSKNLICDEQFVHMICSILVNYDVTATRGKVYYEEEKMSAFMEIWDTSTDSHKNYATENEHLEHIVVNDILHSAHKVSPSGLTFVLEFLSMKNTHYRKKVILESDLRFALRNDFDAINNILELCLPNPMDKEEFRRTRKTSIMMPFFCEILYSQYDYDELKKRLTSCLKKLNIDLYYVNELIEWIIFIGFENRKMIKSTDIFDEKGWEKLSYFINDIFPKDLSLFLEMKNSYLSSLATDNRPNLNRKYTNLSQLCKMIELEFVYEHQKYLKRKCITFFQKTHPQQWVWYVSKQQKFTSIFSWCFENHKTGFPEFKYLLPVNEIFDEVFRQYYSITRLYSLITVLDEFLKCHFSGKTNELIAFKSHNMDNPDVGETLKYLAEHDEELYEEVLIWFNSPELTGHE
ncbi:uncharacterized protein LOC135847281 [Planococcus citri]|uniref:uncharacterized protein LOC135847281 n=1 Tax=Planococcus citri TaxID=170843 RepID=UPI0031F759C5